MKAFLFIINIFVFNLAVAEQTYDLSTFFAKNPIEKLKSKNFEKIVKKDKAERIKKQVKSIKIAIIYPGNQVSDYWRRSSDSFKKRLKQRSIKHTIQEFYTTPGVELKEQEKQILKALRHQPDYLVFTLDAKKHKRIIERILSKKRPKVILQNITTPLKKWGNRGPLLYVGFDHETGSKIIADWYINKTGGKGEYAVIYYTKGLVSEMRGKTFINYINKHSHLKLTNAIYTNGSKESGKNAALKIIKRNKNIKFIYACATDIALGALEAKNELKIRSKIRINGWGGGSAELESISKNGLDVTVMRMNDDNGIAMADAMALDIEGSTNQIPKVYSGRFELVTTATTQQELEKLKEKAFRFSGK